MEEARYRALFLAMFMLMLTIGGKCSYLRAKLAHLAGHLPPPPRFSSINCMRRAREQCAWLLPIRHPSPAHTILFIATGQSQQTPSAQQTQQQTALPPEAINEPVRAIKAPRTPLPGEEVGEHRLDHVITGGGGAQLYAYSGDSDTRDYIKNNADQKVTLDRIAKPAYEPGQGAYHYVLVKVDGDRISLEVIGVD